MQVLEKILQEIMELEKERPYKIFGFPDTYDKYNEAWQDCLDRVENILCSHMEDEHVSNPYKLDDGWIPVEERLPEVPEGTEDAYCPEFNVTIEGFSESTTLKYNWDGTWFDDSGYLYNVIAWQPLPASYQPKPKEQ